MKILPVPAMLIFVLFPVLLPAQGPFLPMKDPDVFKKKLGESTRSTNTLRSDFTQVKNLSVMADRIVSKGKFYFRKEKQLRWEYTEPFSYCIIMNDDRVWIRDESKETRFDARSNRMFREINGIMIGCVRGTILNDGKNFKSVLQENPDLYLVKLYPQNPQFREFLAEIRICFDRANLSVRRLEMVEASGDDTRIDFTGTRINQPLDDELFRIP